MSLSAIDLPTNKSATIVDDDRRKIRQSEKGLILSVIIQNANNSSYDLTGKTIQFNEMKDGGKVVIDDGNGPGSGKITITDAQAGEFDYTLQAQVYAESGTCWFAIIDGDEVIDTTKNFYFDVEPSATINIDNDNYVSEMEAQLNNLKAVIQRVGDKLNEMTTTAGNTVQAAVDNATSGLNEMTAKLNDYTERYNSLQAAWDQELKNAQDAADAEQASIQSTADNQQKTIQDANDKARIAAIDAINDTFNKKLAALQQDYANWQTSTTANYQKQVDAILAQVQGNGTEVANVQKQVDETAAKMQDLNKQFSNVDFTQFLKPSALDNYYTKAEVDGKLSSTGKVKTVNHANPDDSGNIQIDTGVTRFNGQTGDVTFKVVHDDYDSPQAAFDASKTEDGIHIYDPDNGPASSVVDGETITVTKNHDAIAQLQQELGSLQGIVNGKADETNVSNLQSMITGLSTKVDSLQQNSHKIVPITQADYDALSTKDPNTIYAIGG